MNGGSSRTAGGAHAGVVVRFGHCRWALYGARPVKAAEHQRLTRRAVRVAALSAGGYLILVTVGFVVGLSGDSSQELRYLYFVVFTLPWILLGPAGHGIVTGWVSALVNAASLFTL